MSFPFFTVSPETAQLALEMMALQAFNLIPKSLNMIIIVGLCRSGGDTLFSCILDTATVWAVAVPLAFLGVHLGFPLWGVYLCVCSEEFAKALGVSRQTISSLETGRYNPSIFLAWKIARYFGMTIEEVFIFEEDDLNRR